MGADDRHVGAGRERAQRRHRGQAGGAIDFIDRDQPAQRGRGAPDAAAAAPLYLEAFYAASQAAHPAHACGATIAAEVDALLAQHCAGGARPAACAALTAIQADAATLPR